MNELKKVLRQIRKAERVHKETYGCYEGFHGGICEGLDRAGKIVQKAIKDMKGDQ